MITVYSTPTCAFCHAVKEYFKSKAIKFTEKDLTQDEKAAKWVYETTGQLAVPVIDIDGTRRSNAMCCPCSLRTRTHANSLRVLMLRILKFAICCAFVSVTLPHHASAQAAVPDSVRYPCRKVHTFDYWAGTWDATPWNQPTAPSGGTLTNTREYEGCVFVERWEGKGNRGMSLVIYDATKKTWRMFWNNDSNGSTVFDHGEYRDGAMRFTGWTTAPKGDVVMASNVLQNVSPDTIRHIFSISRDSGKTWLTLSDGRFVRRKK